MSNLTQTHYSKTAGELPAYVADEIEIRHFIRLADALRAAMATGDIATAREMFDDIEVLALNTESAEVRDLCKPYLLPN